MKSAMIWQGSPSNVSAAAECPFGVPGGGAVVRRTCILALLELRDFGLIFSEPTVLHHSQSAFCQFAGTATCHRRDPSSSPYRAFLKDMLRRIPGPLPRALRPRRK